MGDSYTNKLRVHISTSLPFEINIFLNVKLTQKCVEITQPCVVKKFKSYSERGSLDRIHLIKKTTSPLGRKGL